MHRRVRRPSTKLVAWNPKVLACCVFGDLPQYQALRKGKKNINRCPRKWEIQQFAFPCNTWGVPSFESSPGPIQADDTLIFKPGDGYRPGMLEEIPSSECWWFEITKFHGFITALSLFYCHVDSINLNPEKIFRNWVSPHFSMISPDLAVSFPKPKPILWHAWRTKPSCSNSGGASAKRCEGWGAAEWQPDTVGVSPWCKWTIDGKQKHWPVTSSNLQPTKRILNNSLHGCLAMRQFTLESRVFTPKYPVLLDVLPQSRVL